MSRMTTIRISVIMRDILNEEKRRLANGKLESTDQVIARLYEFYESKNEKKGKKGIDKMRGNFEEATEFIKSCWDENNPNDGLNCDERVAKGINSLKPEVIKLVEELMKEDKES